MSLTQGLSYRKYAYVDRTKPIRGNTTALFVSTKKPYKQVTTSTLSRWMKCMLEASGINVKVFKGHSVRTAAASAAHRAGASIRDILKAGSETVILQVTRQIHDNPNHSVPSLR